MEFVKSEINVEVIHIGNTGSRCQFPVYKVCVLDKEFTVTPAKRKVTYIYEVKLHGVFKRRVIEIKNSESIDWILNKVGAFLSNSATLSTLRPIQGGAA